MSIKIEDLENTDFSDVAIKGKRLLPTTPGEILRRDFMEPLDLSANALANAIHVPPNRITAILDSQKPRAITAETAMRLGYYFGNSPRFWMNLQTSYELEVAQQKSGSAIKREIQSSGPVASVRKVAPE